MFRSVARPSQSRNLLSVWLRTKITAPEYLMKLRAQTNLPAMAKSLVDPSNKDIITNDHLNYGLFRFYLARRFSLAEEIIHFMEQNPELQPTSKSYAFLIAIYSKKKNHEKVIETFERTKNRGVDVNIIMIHQYLNSLAKSGRIEQLEKEIGALKQDNLISEISYNVLVEGYLIVNQPEKALQVIEEMKASEKFRPSVVTYTLLVNQLGKTDIPQAIKFFEIMKSEGLNPNHVTFSSIINSFAQAGDLENGMVWLNKMKESNVKLVLSPYATLINGFAKTKQYTYVSKLVKMLNEDNILLNDHYKKFVSRILAQAGIPLSEILNSKQ